MSNWHQFKDHVSRFTPVLTQSDTEFMVHMAALDGRTQVVSIKRYNEHFIRLFSPIANSNEATADQVLNTTRLFGIGTDEGFLGLVHVLPINSINYDELMAFIQVFAAIADQGEASALGTDQY